MRRPRYCPLPLSVSLDLRLASRIGDTMERHYGGLQGLGIALGALEDYLHDVANGRDAVRAASDYFNDRLLDAVVTEVTRG